MAETFKCPSCAAPLEFEGKMMQKCKFCESNVIVPSNVMQTSNAFGGAGVLDFGDLSALKGKALKIGEIQKLIQSGNKIYAIKLFRETFGGSLMEAKDAVDAMEDGKSIDISGMQIHATNFRTNAQNLEAVKKVGIAIGGSMLGIFVFTAILIVGVIAVIAYFIWNLTSKAIEESSRANRVSVTNIQIPQFPQFPQDREETSNIAQEILKFGGEGTGAGKFKDNRTIAVDADGRIYSAEYSEGRIQIFDADGKFQTQIMAGTNKALQALATDRKSNLFVLENYDISRFDTKSGELLGKSKVDYATDLAIGLDGKIYVSSRKGEIYVLNSDGSKLKTIQVGKDSALEDIRQIAVDGAGNFYALDGKTSAIFKFSADGKFLTRFGGRSSESSDKMPKSSFSSTPYDLAIDSKGRVFVSQSSRISIFDAEGNFLNDFKLAQAFGIAFNDKDELFVASRPFVVKYKLSF